MMELMMISILGPKKKIHRKSPLRMKINQPPIIPVKKKKNLLVRTKINLPVTRSSLLIKELVKTEMTSFCSLDTSSLEL